MSEESDKSVEQTTESNVDVHLSEHEGATKFYVVYNKKNIPFFFDLEKETVGVLKECVQKETKVISSGMKLMLRGVLLKDDQKTLAQAGIKASAKLLLVGSVASDVAEISKMKSAPEPEPVASTAKTPAKLPVSLGEGIQDLPVHRRVIEDGPPENAMVGFADYNDVLPRTPITGLLNSRHEHTRLSFKVFQQELWISTSSSTEKVPFHTIRNVMYEPIKGNNKYCIMALQLGATDSESSRYYLYWVPAQYAQAIRKTIL